MWRVRKGLPVYNSMGKLWSWPEGPLYVRVMMRSNVFWISGIQEKIPKHFKIFNTDTHILVFFLTYFKSTCSVMLHQRVIKLNPTAQNKSTHTVHLISYDPYSPNLPSTHPFILSHTNLWYVLRVIDCICDVDSLTSSYSTHHRLWHFRLVWQSTV